MESGICQLYESMLLFGTEVHDNFCNFQQELIKTSLPADSLHRYFTLVIAVHSYLVCQYVQQSD